MAAPRVVVILITRLVATYTNKAKRMSHPYSTERLASITETYLLILLETEYEINT